MSHSSIIISINSNESDINLKIKSPKINRKIIPITQINNPDSSQNDLTFSKSDSSQNDLTLLTLNNTNNSQNLKPDLSEDSEYNDEDKQTKGLPDSERVRSMVLKPITNNSNFTKVIQGRVPKENYKSDNTIYNLVVAGRSIGRHAFDGCNNLERVKLNNVKRIHRYAFNNCPKLRDLDLGTSLKSISEGVFNGCANLASITIPSTITYMSSSIFKNCWALSNITFDCPEIPNDILKNRLTLKFVNIGQHVRVINQSAFENCENLITVNINDNAIITINDNAFKKSGIQFLVLPSKSILNGSNIFKDCISLKTFIAFDSIIDRLNINIFNGCESLNNIKIIENNKLVIYDMK